MKKIILLVAILCSVSIGRAQEKKVNSKEIKFHNNFEASVGFGSMAEIVGALTFSLNGMNWGEKTYDYGRDMHSLPAINLSYNRQLTPLVGVGVIVSYSHVMTDMILVESGEKVGSYLFGTASFIPSVRFDWLRHDIFHCYSRVGFGVAQCLDRTFHDDPLVEDLNNDILIPFADVVPFGVLVGRKLYGYAEVSLGLIGFCKIGAGYRF